MIKRILTSICLTTCAITTVSAANISPDIAEKRLNSSAVEKINKGHINLKSLLKNDSNDLIVEYNINTEQLSSNADKRSSIASNKQAFRKSSIQTNGVTILRDYNNLPITSYRIKDREALVQLLNDPNIKGFYPNRINSTFATNNLNLINQPQTSQKGFGGEGTSVVIADTGVNYKHSDFGSCTAVNTPSSTCRVIQSFDTAPDDNQLDDNGHGSNVAGIVAQVAPKTKIIAIDVFDGQGAADTDILAAINWTSNNAKTYNIKAINLSLGVPNQPYYSECTNNSYATAFTTLRSNNVVPVVASGNDAFSNAISYPACAKGAVRVGAVYDSNYGRIGWSNCTDSTTAADKITCFSNSSKLLTLLAPGAIITAAGIQEGGTSQATPHVAGALAVLRADNITPTETIDQTIARLQNTGKAIRDPRNSITTSRIDLLAATNTLTTN